MSGGMGVTCSTSGQLLKAAVVLQQDIAVIPEFSQPEKAAIRSVWATLDRQSDSLATDIFLRIFQLRPEIKDFFPFRDATGEDLVRHPYFKSHAIRFINAVRMTVSNMDAWEVIHIPNLRQLGQYHTRIPGFSHDIFQVFFYAMNDMWAEYLGRAYDSETRDTWSKLFRFIINQVEIGYLEHTQQLVQDSLKVEDTASISQGNSYNKAVNDTEVLEDTANNISQENSYNMAVNDTEVLEDTANNISQENSYNMAAQDSEVQEDTANNISRENSYNMAANDTEVLEDTASISQENSYDMAAKDSEVLASQVAPVSNSS